MKITSVQNNFYSKNNLQNTPKIQKSNSNNINTISFQKGGGNGFKSLIKKAFSWADFDLKLEDNLFKDIEKDIYEDLYGKKKRNIIYINLPENMPTFSRN